MGRNKVDTTCEEYSCLIHGAPFHKRMKRRVGCDGLRWCVSTPSDAEEPTPIQMTKQEI